MPDYYISDVIEFPKPSTEKAEKGIYVYPHRYHIELRHTHHGWEQRHVWMWDDGTKEIEKWINSRDHSIPGGLKGYTKVQELTSQ